MKFRFRFVNRSGVEVEVESVEAMRECVSSGTIHEETLLYDGLTRDWAPARVHPIYRLIRDTHLVDEPEPADWTPLESLESDGNSAMADSPSDGLEMTLLPPEEDDPLSEFWESQERAGREADLEGLSVEEEGFNFSFGRELNSPPSSPQSPPQSPPQSSEPPPTTRQSETPLARQSQSFAVRQSPPVAAAGDGSEPTGLVAADSEIPAPAANKLQNLDVPDWGLRWVSRAELNRALHTPVPQRQAALMVLLAGVGGWGIADSWTPPLSEPTSEVVLLNNSWRVSTHFTAGHPDVRSGAFQDMVRGMDVMRARMGVGDPPSVWLTDSYLDSPSAYPEVAEHWARYGDFVDSLHTREEDFFRSGFVTRMQRKGITGTVLSIQVAREVSAFRDNAPRRAALYVAMSELSVSALMLHDLLIAGEADGPTRWGAIERVVAAMTQVAGEDPRDAGRLGSAALQALEELPGDVAG